MLLKEEDNNDKIFSPPFIHQALKQTLQTCSLHFAAAAQRWLAKLQSWSLAMELLTAHSPPLTALTVSRSSLAERPSFLSGPALPLDLTRRRSNVKNPNCLGVWTTGLIHVTAKSRAKTIKAAGQDSGLKEGDLAFVAGATGRVGSRAVRELLKLGFQVRAGIRSKQKADTLVNSVQQMEGGSGIQYVEKLQIVECDLEKQEGIKSAIGSASVVLCCIGASEKEVFDITGPYRIDYLATKNLIDAATNAKVKHFILLTSLGTNKLGFPAAILNLFWGVLIWKRKAEEALIASGLPYSIVRPGGMERPTDAYKLTHNMVLSIEDTLFGGQVSNLQVAELMAFMAKNRDLSFCKVVEVIAETNVPLTPLEDLLSKIPSKRVDTSKLEESPALQKEPVPSQVIFSAPQVDQGKIEPEAPKTRALSPYFVYDDLKPPTSPTPLAPSTGVSDFKRTSMGAVNANQAPVTDKSPEKQHLNQHKLRPLSPFTMYEDLKPPSSPSPSFK